MSKTAIDVPLPDRISKLAEDLAAAEGLASYLRGERNALFVQAYDDRAISVTEMARIAGVRRETVHEAINRTKKEMG